MKYDNCISFFNNSYHKKNKKSPNMKGRITCEGINYHITLYENKGKTIYYNGISVDENGVTTGYLFIHKNMNTSPKASIMRGTYTINNDVLHDVLHRVYHVNVWPYTNRKNGLPYFAGTIKLKDPEMLYKKGSIAKVEKPESFDDSTF